MQKTIENITGPIVPFKEDRSGYKHAAKMVTCIIRPDKLDAVKEALNTLNLVGGMTVMDVRGFGRQRGAMEFYRGESYTIRLIPKVKIELVIPNEDVEEVLKVVGQLAHTGEVGDGKIYVTDINNAMRIRTQEMGYDAL